MAPVPTAAAARLGRRIGRRGRRLRRRLGQQDQQQARALGVPGRLDVHLHEGRGADLDVAHRAHRQAGREQAVEPRGDDQVAFAHVGVGAQVAQLDGAGERAAVGDRALAGAADLDRDGRVAVGDQGDLARQREHPRDLADHAAGVDDRLPGDHPVLLPLVEHELARERVARVVEHLGHGRAHHRALAHRQQLAQLPVLDRELLGLQQRIGVGGLEPAQLDVLGAQPAYLAQVLGAQVDEVARHQQGSLHRIQHGGDSFAQPSQHVEP